MSRAIARSIVRGRATGPLQQIGARLACIGYAVADALLVGSEGMEVVVNLSECAATGKPKIRPGGKFPKSPGAKPGGKGGDGGNGGGGKPPKKPGRCSFHEDTEVLTDGGYLPIIDLSVGQSKVWSRNEITGEMGWQPITARYSNPYHETVTLEIRDVRTGVGQTIVSNRIHPFFVQMPNTGEMQLAKAGAKLRSLEGHVYHGPIKNGIWIDAAELKPGYRLLNANGAWSEIVGTHVEQKPLRAYNITVANISTFFVRGESKAANDNVTQAVWVHNCDKPEGIPDNWKGKPIGKGKGTKYHDPNNPDHHVRVRQNKDGSWYAKHHRGGTFRDKFGNPVGGKSPDAHIPLGEFKF